MQVRAFGASDVGKVRSANEDSFLVDGARQLYIVADGMGGHQGGGFASSHAIEWIQEEIGKLELSQESTEPLPRHSDKTPTQIRLYHALTATNRRLFQKALEEPSLHGMGTTVTSLQFDNQHANIAHVGDSRIYLLRDDILFQVSRDHSWVQEQVDAGLLSEDEARDHPLKNIITRSMGHEPEVEIDLYKEAYQPGDKFVLCSDGLSNMVNDDTIRKIISKMELESAVKELIKRALEAGGLDNTTALLVEVTP